MGSVARDLLTFTRLPQPQRAAIVRALLMVPRVSRSLRRIGYRGTREMLSARRPLHLPVQEATETAKRVDSSIRRLPWNPRCLERSLVVWWVAGEAAEIRLGVAPADEAAERRFHAWVEVGGTVLNDDADITTRYLPLSSSRADSVRSADFASSRSRSKSDRR